MKALEKKVLNMVYGKEYNYVVCSIRWNDSKEIQHDLVFQVGGNPEDANADDDVFFYCEDINQLISLCHNIDFTIDDFDNWTEYTYELSNYDDDDFYFNNGEDFSIVDISCIY